MYEEGAVSELRGLHEEEVLEGSEGVLGSLLVSPRVGFISIAGETDSGGGLQEEKVGNLVPTVLVFIEQVAQLVGVADHVGADLLQQADETGTARPTVEPEREGGGVGIGDVGLHEHVVDLAAGLVGVEVAGVDDDVGHALSGRRGTVGEETLSPSGSARANDRIATRSNFLIIYLLL